MTEAEAQVLASDGIFRNRKLNGDLLETHISWIILSGAKAFKLKKPVKFSFLDFSTLRRRKVMIEKELKLNKRTTNIYKKAVAVRLLGGKYIIGERKGKIIDYALLMRRLPEDLRLDHQLRKGKVDRHQVKRLARSIAGFHARSKVIKKPFDLLQSKDLFNEILQYESSIKHLLGKEYYQAITHAAQWSDRFLTDHEEAFRKRRTVGFVRDVHGDLHTGNIFMLKKPVIFDCIEFNDEYRRIDVLYEVAFLLMDMEELGRPQLADELLKEYLKGFSCMHTQELPLLNYYKCLRANVRAKVNLIRAKQTSSRREIRSAVGQAKNYIRLMQAYIENG